MLQVPRRLLRRPESVFILAFLIYFAAAAAPSFAQPEPAFPAAPSEKAGSITLDFKDADITTVLRVMSLKSNVNIVAGPEVKGTITIRLENVPWEKALEVVLRTYGYVHERDGNIIRVTTRENLAGEPLVTQTYILNYTKASEIQAAVQDMLTERGRIKVAERTNTIVLTDIPTNLYSISEIIKKLDRMTPQAYIDSKIVKTELGITENLGIEWRTGGASNNIASLTGSGRPTTFPFATDTQDDREILGKGLALFTPIVAGNSVNAVTGNVSSSTSVNTADARAFPFPSSLVANNTFSFGTMSFTGFNAVLQMLKSRANTKVVSNPRIVVLNNQTAEIHVGDNIPLPRFETNQTTGRLNVSGFDYDKLKTGVELKVTPHINSEEEILVDLQPSVNARGDTITFNADLSAPIINETTAKTQVLIRSGETIAIGGLLTDNVAINEARVPYLSDVPFFGKLFRSKRQTAGSGNAKVETLFFVTVTMVDTEGQPMGERVEKQKTAARKAALKAEPPSSEPVGTVDASNASESGQPSEMDLTGEIAPSDATVPAETEAVPA